MNTPTMSISTEIAELSFDEKNLILHIRMKEGAEMNLENTKDHYELIKEITYNTRHRVLVDSSLFFTVDSSAFKYSTKEEFTSKRIAVAHYNPCLANRLLLHYFKGTYSPPMPFKIFKNKEEALKWLKSIEDED